MNLLIKVSAAGAGILYVLSQALFLREDKIYVSFLAIFLYLISPLWLIYNNESTRRQLSSKKFIVIFSSALIFTLAFNDVYLFKMDMIKLIVLFISSVLVMSERGKETLVSYVDGALAATLGVVLAAHFGLIETRLSIVNGLWEKSYGGFSNPNNGPYFIYVATVIYYLYGGARKFYLSIIALVVILYFGIFSRTYLIACLILLFSNLVMLTNNKKIKFSYLKLLISIGSISMLFGVIFYLGIIIYPEMFIEYRGSALDLILSSRITVGLDEPLYISDSLSGVSFARLDSMYVEIIYYCGPICAFCYFIKFFSFKLKDLGEDGHYRSVIIYSLLAILGIFESQFFNITPIGSIIASIMYSNIFFKGCNKTAPIKN
jgi:hypothetical protein